MELASVRLGLAVRAELVQEEEAAQQERVAPVLAPERRARTVKGMASEPEVPRNPVAQRYLLAPEVSDGQLRSERSRFPWLRSAERLRPL